MDLNFNNVMDREIKRTNKKKEIITKSTLSIAKKQPYNNN